MVAAHLQPLVEYPGANEPWESQCLKCEAIVMPRFSNISSGQGGCIHCGLVASTAAKWNDPDQAAETMRRAHLRPLVDYPGVNEPWMCQCLKCGEVVTPQFANIKTGQGGCRKCGTVITAMKLQNDAVEAAAKMEAAGLEPLETYPGALSPWKCRCTKCGREVAPTYHTIHRGKGGCWMCGVALRASMQMLDPDEAVSIMRAADLEPLEVYPGSNRPWKCTCNKCFRQVTPHLSSIQGGRGGCKFCADYGFDRTAPGIVYLMTNYEYVALKIGVTTTNASKDRIGQHKANGWTLIQKWSTPTGDDAEVVEATVLKWWREGLGAPAFVPRVAMPQDGASETASLAAVDLYETIAFIDEELKKNDIDGSARND
jgi:hypothetical protein